MADKASGIMRTAGFSVCLLYIAYALYIAGSRLAVSALGMSGEKAFVIVGMAAVAEGEVVHAGDGHTTIRYYYEWDGTEYQSVKNTVSADYPDHAKIPVIYTVGTVPGSCLAVGFYRSLMRIPGAAGAVLLLAGIGLKFRKKEEKNGKKKDHSGQLEDEYDSQRSREAVR
ncbi:MAG: hypothetical protein NC432_14610 [Roseburia sp.]|nr:hypothetical protein [Roseburia sp.]MCM1098655.1 hypothetical protein [Ruminococcus flavefaciens]